MHALTGEWNVTITSMMGEERSIWKLNADNNTISGSLVSADSGEEVGTVQETLNLTDQEFSFKTTLSLPFGKMPFTMTGMIDKDTLTGTAAMPMGESKFVANRK